MASSRSRGGGKIALYFTGRQHAGENMADVLKQRAAELASADSDVRCVVAEYAESCRVEILLANCMAHGRRQFVEIAPNFPDECRYVLESLGEVYHNDADGAGAEALAGGAAALASGVKRPVMEQSACVAGGAVGGEEDGAELGAGQGDHLSVAALDKD